MQRFYPYLFVFLWSTGFIGARYGLPHAEPLTFLLLRYALVITLMGGLAVVMDAPWPKSRRQICHIAVTGVLMHGVYLAGVFLSIKQGLPTAMVSLLAGLQPLLTAVVSGLLLHETVGRRRWLGLGLGLVGTVLVLSGRLQAGFGLTGMLPALAALAGITVGTLYQKRFCPGFDWRSGAVIQFTAAFAVTLPVAGVTEQFHVEPVGQFFFALGWLVLVLSLGAISLLNHLLRTGTALKVVSLFYLVPVSTAAIAWLVFGEALSLTACLGMALAVWGVALARR